ncbi:MAG: ribbon-helix-helix protein, CopG family [Aristaeellaceae bacterium]
MQREIRITRKETRKGEDGHKVISVRMKDATLARLEELSAQTNRSRNELINLLLEAALDDVSVVGEDE